MGRTKSSRKWCLCISISIALTILIIAIVVPLAVILPRREHPKPAVLLPLYIYPQNNNTWRPLYEAVEAHPELRFVVVVNPANGPGPSPYPDQQYTAQVEQLNACSNIITIGYIRTGYATKDIADVIAEVSTYAGWASNSTKLAMHGIFFDEAPHVYSAAAAEYMRTINQAVKDATGLQGDRTVIHNPGVIPDSGYNDINTDITVIFENSYAAYQTSLASIAALPRRPSQYSLLINSVPTMSATDLETYVNQLRGLAEFLFITNNENQFYESFGSDWTEFTDALLN